MNHPFRIARVPLCPVPLCLVPLRSPLLCELKVVRY